ncbi:MAG TPA: hypothetical protein VK720_06220 [Terracidiphilus sp.]|nr:hypothetical protein [Terracidiphilus sp.]
MRPRFAIFRLRQKSLMRGGALSLAAFLASLRLAGFPNLANLHGSRWQLACLVFAVWGMFDIARCLQRKWNFYHGGVLLLLYTDLIIMAMIVLFAIFP